jgi:hypothetical protein
MGRTTTEVEALSRMAALAGKELANVENMLLAIGEAQVDALGGNEAKLGAFARAGITREDLANKNELEIASMMAKNLDGKSMAELRGLGMSDIIGKKNLGTFGAMQGDLGDFRKKHDNMVRRGELIDPVAMEKFNASMDELGEAFAKTKAGVINGLLPIVDVIIKVLREFVAGMQFTSGVLGDFINLFTSFAGNISEAIKNPTKAFSLLFKEPMKEFAKNVGQTGHEYLKARKDIWDGSEEKEARERIAAKEEASKAGPGEVVKKPEKPSASEMAGAGPRELSHVPVPERIPFSSNGLTSDASLGRGGFMGVNRALLGAINNETNDILKKIEKNTRAINAANATNAMIDTLGAMLGIEVK